MASEGAAGLALRVRGQFGYRLIGLMSAATAGLLGMPLAAQPALTVEQAVGVYARGRFDEAIRRVNARQLTVASFTGALDAWIEDGDSASRSKRQLVAAAFALDSVWSHTRTPFNPRREPRDPGAAETRAARRVGLSTSAAQPLIAVWSVEQLPSGGTPDVLERALWLTAVGLTQDAYASRQLLRDVLPRATRRLPDEPRLRLADVLARTHRDLGPLRDGTARRSDVLRVEKLAPAVLRRIPDAIRQFEPLLTIPALAAEVELRMGYLELRRGNADDALQKLGASASGSLEPTLQAAAHYLAGWIHEQLGRHEAAIDSYRKALAITPATRNLATRLAALLFLGRNRAEAYAVLDTALNADPAPVDLLVAVERGDSRFVEGWLMAIRKELR